MQIITNKSEKLIFFYSQKLELENINSNNIIHILHPSKHICSFHFDSEFSHIFEEVYPLFIIV